MAKAIDSNPLGRNCIDCAYHGKLGGMVCCNYWEKVGRMRPSPPPGDACTAKVKFRRRSYPAKGRRATE